MYITNDRTAARTPTLRVVGVCVRTKTRGVRTGVR